MHSHYGYSLALSTKDFSGGFIFNVLLALLACFLTIVYKTVYFYPFTGNYSTTQLLLVLI